MAIDRNCFAGGGDATDGAWAAQPLLPRPYRLNATLWGKVGTSITSRTPQHYGRCDDVAQVTTPRTLYEWEPRGCTVRPAPRCTPASLTLAPCVLSPA